MLVDLRAFAYGINKTNYQEGLLDLWHRVFNVILEPRLEDVSLLLLEQVAVSKVEMDNIKEVEAAIYGSGRKISDLFAKRNIRNQIMNSFRIIDNKPHKFDLYQFNIYMTPLFRKVTTRSTIHFMYGSEDVYDGKLAFTTLNEKTKSIKSLLRTRKTRYMSMYNIATLDALGALTEEQLKKFLSNADTMKGNGKFRNLLSPWRLVVLGGLTENRMPARYIRNLLPRLLYQEEYQQALNALTNDPRIFGETDSISAILLAGNETAWELFDMVVMAIDEIENAIEKMSLFDPIMGIFMYESAVRLGKIDAWEGPLENWEALYRNSLSLLHFYHGWIDRPHIHNAILERYYVDSDFLDGNELLRAINSFASNNGNYLHI